MKILIIMDPGILVPPKGYGGHERLVELFANEYLKLGHQVSLLVTEGSEVNGCKIYSLGQEGFPPQKNISRLAIVKSWKFVLTKNFDLIHNFGRLAYLLPILNSSTPKIMTYGRIISKRNIKYINYLPNKNLYFTAPSDWCVNTGNISGKWTTVYNSINFKKYDLVENLDSSAPLIFLGRLERLKGAHIAIKLAIELGENLIIAGNISKLPEEIIYFKEEIEPFIDNKHIKYVGTVNDKQKNEYLGKSKALLFPAETNEAFGLVMIESMACGTPVIGYRNKGNSAVQEIIDDDITGFVVDDFLEMKNMIKQVSDINRKKCRIRAYERFNSSFIAKQYLSIIKPIN